jgi:YggT family protein
MTASIITAVFSVLQILIFARVIISWIRPDPYNPIVKFIYDATEPLLQPIRRLLPPMSGIDFSPIILLFGFSFLQRTLLSIL